MLHQEAVEPSTLELIRALQQEPELDHFILVGGTALALHLGHRKSVDIDLFCPDPFDVEALTQYLDGKYRFSLQYAHRNTLKGTIDGIFVDLITHNYPLVERPAAWNGIRLASEPDIAAMKANVISANGTRGKDFIDLYFLLKKYSFGDVVRFFKAKYGARNEFHMVKSLTYFDDIDENSWPVMILEPDLTLYHLKKTIQGHMNRYLQELIR